MLDGINMSGHAEHLFWLGVRREGMLESPHPRIFQDLFSEMAGIEKGKKGKKGSESWARGHLTFRDIPAQIAHGSLISIHNA